MRLFSPAQLNPFGHNPLWYFLHDLVDQRRLREPRAPQLFVSATDVETGRAVIFDNATIDADVLCASACLPFVFPAGGQCENFDQLAEEVGDDSRRAQAPQDRRAARQRRSRREDRDEDRVSDSRRFRGRRARTRRPSPRPSVSSHPDLSRDARGCATRHGRCDIRREPRRGLRQRWYCKRPAGCAIPNPRRCRA